MGSQGTNAAVITLILQQSCILLQVQETQQTILKQNIFFLIYLSLISMEDLKLVKKIFAEFLTFPTTV